MSSCTATADNSTPPSFPKLTESISYAVKSLNPELLFTYTYYEFHSIVDLVTLEAWAWEYDAQLKAHLAFKKEISMVKVSIFKFFFLFQFVLFPVCSNIIIFNKYSNLLYIIASSANLYSGTNTTSPSLTSRTLV